MICEWAWLGETPYADAWALQESLAAEIASGGRPPALLLLEHPHTYTLGRRADKANLLWDEDKRAEKSVQVFEVDRGGDVTYHGPGQLVGYPILPLAAPGWQGDRLPKADFIGYIRSLEQLLIHLLADFEIAAGTLPGKTGVWVSPDPQGLCPQWNPLSNRMDKIASIGVKIDAKGVSRHGFALNVSPDKTYWDGIIPCGLENVRMVSMADFTRCAPDLPELAEILANHFGYLNEYQMQRKRPDRFMPAGR